MQTNHEVCRPSLIFLIGPSGSGKTVLSLTLASLMKWPPIDTDELIEARECRPISDIFESKGEAYFRRIESEVVDKIVADYDRGIVATGGGLPTIDGMMERISKTGVTVFLKASVDELWNRLTVDRTELEKRPLLRKKGRAGLEEMMRRREAVYNSAKVTVITDGMSVDAIAEKILGVLVPLLHLD